jgi:hypothetical protein
MDEGEDVASWHRWHHVAAVYDRYGGWENTMQFYLNGIRIESASTTRLNPADNNEPVGIGCEVAPDGTVGHFFSGLIDDVRVFDIALRPCQFQLTPAPDEYASCPSPEDGERYIWPCDNDVALSWRAGLTAKWHDVYFGTDFSEVSDADTSSTVYKARLEYSNTCYYPPEPVEDARTYYWRIDEVDDTNVYKGDIWSFNRGCGVYTESPDLLQTWENPSHTADDGFGYCVAVAGNKLLVGAPYAKGSKGRAYLLDGSTGNIIHIFEGDGGGMFGKSVAWMENTVVIGAPYDNTGSGVVYLFDSTTGDPLPPAIFNPTPADNDEFGASVALVGNDILVGAPGDDAGAQNAGVVHSFDGSSHNFLRSFQKPAPVADDRFGTSVAAMGDNVLVGVPYHDINVPDTSHGANGENAGAVYLFDGTTGNQLQIFLSPLKLWNDLSNGFGNCIAVLGNNVLVGAPYNRTYGLQNGAAYMFDGSTGNLLHTFWRPTKPYPDDYFGRSIAAVGNNVLIGARSTGAHNSYGEAFLFSGSTGAYLMTINNPTPQEGDLFGSCFAVMGSNIIIGAPGDQSSGNAGGAVYLFEGLPTGDFEPDGDVDFADYAVLAGQWRQPPGSPSADLAPGGGDGIVDWLDLKALCDNWLAGVE